MFVELWGIVVITLGIGFIAGAVFIFSMVEFALKDKGHNLMDLIRGDE